MFMIWEEGWGVMYFRFNCSQWSIAMFGWRNTRTFKDGWKVIIYSECYTEWFWVPTSYSENWSYSVLLEVTQSYWELTPSHQSQYSPLLYSRCIVSAQESPAEWNKTAQFSHSVFHNRRTNRKPFRNFNFDSRCIFSLSTFPLSFSRLSLSRPPSFSIFVSLSVNVSPSIFLHHFSLPHYLVPYSGQSTFLSDHYLRSR